MGFFSRNKTTPPETVPEIAPEIVPTYESGARVDQGPSDEVEVSAIDGPMPPMIEQFKAIQARGGTSVDVALTNTGLVEDVELLELVELEIREAATQYGLTVNTITRR
jgi:translation elongation factor EF-Tu-like GTPase